MQLFLSPLIATPFSNTRTAPHRWPCCAARLESCPADQLCFPKQDWTGFETLSRLVIKPGNPRLCGPAPQGLGFSREFPCPGSTDSAGLLWGCAIAVHAVPTSGLPPCHALQDVLWTILLPPQTCSLSL